MFVVVVVVVVVIQLYRSPNYTPMQVEIILIYYQNPPSYVSLLSLEYTIKVVKVLWKVLHGLGLCNIRIHKRKWKYKERIPHVFKLNIYA